MRNLLITRNFLRIDFYELLTQGKTGKNGEVREGTPGKKESPIVTKNNILFSHIVISDVCILGYQFNMSPQNDMYK